MIAPISIDCFHRRCYAAQAQTDSTGGFNDKKIFKKILKICLQTRIEDRNLRAEILDILHFTTYLMLCHRDKKDVYKIKNFKKVEEKFGEYFQIIRQISKKFITE